MGCCFGRKRDQNDDLLENEIDLESQEVIKSPTQSSPKHGSLSSLVPSKQIVLAVIGALLLLCVSIGGYAAWRKKRKAELQLLQQLPFDTIRDNLLRGAHNLANDVHSRLGDDGIRDARNIISDIHSDVGAGLSQRPQQRHRRLHNRSDATEGHNTTRAPPQRPQQRLRHLDNRSDATGRRNMTRGDRGDGNSTSDFPQFDFDAFNDRVNNQFRHLRK